MWSPLKDQNNSLINETINYIHVLDSASVSR